MIMKIVYTPKAREDLRSIKKYIKDELLNPTAANNITNRIAKGCSNLKDNPFMGIALKSKFNIDTDIRFLIISNHLAFYKIHDNVIMIIRILDSRTNYLPILFQDK